MIQPCRRQSRFLEWLRDDRFIFLGMRELTFKGKGEKRELVPVKETLGILNDSEVRVLRKDDDDTVTPREVTEFLDSSEPLIVTKANSLSLVHRRSYLDYVGVKIFGAEWRRDWRAASRWSVHIRCLYRARLPVFRSSVPRLIRLSSTLASTVKTIPARRL